MEVQEVVMEVQEESLLRLMSKYFRKLAGGKWVHLQAVKKRIIVPHTLSSPWFALATTLSDSLIAHLPPLNPNPGDRSVAEQTWHHRVRAVVGEAVSADHLTCRPIGACCRVSWLL